MTGRPRFETRERWVQGYKLLFLALVGVNLAVLHALSGSAWAGRLLLRGYALGSALLFSAGAVALLPRRTLRVYQHSVEVTRPLLGNLVLTSRSVQGLGWSMVAGPRTSWARGGFLRDAAGELHFRHYEDPEGLWAALREGLLPGVASRLMARLAEGETVELWGATLRWDRLEVLGEKILWSDLDEVVEQHDGVLLTYAFRPTDARRASRRELPDAVLLRMVLDRRPDRHELDSSVESPWSAEEAKDWTPVRALPGLPASLPDLGACIYTHGDETAEERSVWIDRLAWGAVLHGATGWLPLPGAPALWLTAGALTGVGRWWTRPVRPEAQGRFTVYEGGISDGERQASWSACSSITYEAADRFEVTPLRGALRSLGLPVLPAFMGRASILRLDVGESGFVAYGDSPDFEACCRLIVRSVAPILAGRALDQLQAGGDVCFRDLWVSLRGLHHERCFLPWETYGGLEVARGEIVMAHGDGPGDTGQLTLEAPELRLLQEGRERPALTLRMSEADAYVLQKLLLSLEKVGIVERRRRQLRRAADHELFGDTDAPRPEAPAFAPGDTDAPRAAAPAPAPAPAFAPGGTDPGSVAPTRIESAGPGAAPASGSAPPVTAVPSGATRISEAPARAPSRATVTSDLPGPAKATSGVTQISDAPTSRTTQISDAPAPAAFRDRVVTLAPSGARNRRVTLVDGAPQVRRITRIAPAGYQRRKPRRFGNRTAGGAAGFAPAASRSLRGARVSSRTRLAPARAAARRRRAA